jgi:hypothetical protein
MKRRRQEGKERGKKAIYRDLFYSQFDCVNSPVAELVRASKKKKEKRKRTRLQRKEIVMTEGEEDKLLAAAASLDHSLISRDKATG